MVLVLVLLCLLMAGANNAMESCDFIDVTIEPYTWYTLTSLNYPYAYPGFSYSCTVTGSAPPNYIIGIYCDIFDILNNPSCRYAGMAFSASGDSSFSDATVYCESREFIYMQTSGSSFAFQFYNNYENMYQQTGYRCYLSAFKDDTPTTTTTTAPTAAPPPTTTTTTATTTTATTAAPTTTTTATTTSTTTTAPTSTTTTTAPITTPPSSASCSCGKSNEDSRIVGGSQTNKNKYPWLVALEFADGHQYCGGTLINNQWVLTAAHCIKDFQVSDVFVHLGEHDSSTTFETDSVRIPAKTTYHHEDYSEETIDNDIGLIQLEVPVEFNQIISPACLPFRFPTEDFHDEIGIAAGWGTLSWHGEDSNVTTYVEIPIVGNHECNEYESVQGQLTSNMFCTHGEGVDACQGDSGGPLVWLDEQQFTYYMIGIISWGIECAVPGNPGVYTKVNNYRNWIETHTDGDFCSN